MLKQGSFNNCSCLCFLSHPNFVRILVLLDSNVGRGVERLSTSPFSENKFPQKNFKKLFWEHRPTFPSSLKEVPLRAMHFCPLPKQLGYPSEQQALKLFLFS